MDEQRTHVSTQGYLAGASAQSTQRWRKSSGSVRAQRTHVPGYCEYSQGYPGYSRGVLRVPNADSRIKGVRAPRTHVRDVVHEELQRILRQFPTQM